MEDEYDEEFDSLVDEIEEIMDSQERMDKTREVTLNETYTIDKDEDSELADEENPVADSLVDDSNGIDNTKDSKLNANKFEDSARDSQIVIGNSQPLATSIPDELAHNLDAISSQPAVLLDQMTEDEINFRPVKRRRSRRFGLNRTNSFGHGFGQEEACRSLEQLTSSVPVIDMGSDVAVVGDRVGDKAEVEVGVTPTNNVAPEVEGPITETTLGSSKDTPVDRLQPTSDKNLGDNSPPRLPEDFAFSVHHECAWGCRGSFLPSRYNSSRAKCIKCAICGLFFSPNKFIFHSHRLYNEIHNRRVALGITCVQCTPVQLEILRRAGAMPVSSRRCGMITRREAERLCKSFLGDNSPPRLPEDFAFSVHHECAWGCRGSFLPSRYNSSRAKCIKCAICGLFFSPNKFIFHSHRLSTSAKYVQPDAANFNSWRRHMKLLGAPPDEVVHAWEDVKAMFNGGMCNRGTRKRVNSSPSRPTSRSAPISAEAKVKVTKVTTNDLGHPLNNNNRRYQIHISPKIYKFSPLPPSGTRKRVNSSPSRPTSRSAPISAEAKVKVTKVTTNDLGHPLNNNKEIHGFNQMLPSALSRISALPNLDFWHGHPTAANVPNAVGLKSFPSNTSVTFPSMSAVAAAAMLPAWYYNYTSTNTSTCPSPNSSAFRPVYPAYLSSYLTKLSPRSDVEEGDEGGGGDEDSDEMVDIETCTPEDEFGGAAGVPVSDKKIYLLELALAHCRMQCHLEFVVSCMEMS
ncbi:uncharacterized protein LOC103514152 [Diaphorina citri]|uniref:Uncharacterized protein LOC103514152 n=1 Tax=Diaphorina citri TaxID=121845 RepID=A0A3Q0J8F1_DIACI|nr:uncharacterized protein LOC103514152 [Diaphorina citri]